MPIADDIETLIIRKSPRLHLNAEDIADMLFGRSNAPHKQDQVNAACRQLVEQKRLERNGKGGHDDPYTYHLPLRRP
jgi:hypothetical protein